MNGGIKNEKKKLKEERVLKLTNYLLSTSYDFKHIDELTEYLKLKSVNQTRQLIPLVKKRLLTIHNTDLVNRKGRGYKVGVDQRETLLEMLKSLERAAGHAGSVNSRVRFYEQRIDFDHSHPYYKGLRDISKYTLDRMKEAKEEMGITVEDHNKVYSEVAYTGTEETGEFISEFDE